MRPSIVVEDEVATAKALKLLLEKVNFVVDIAHNGIDGWNYIMFGSYDAIVLDIMLPGMNGLEILAKTRKKHISTPVLMLTAKAEVEDRVTGLEAGADDYLPKPFATSEFIARVKALARRSENYSDLLKSVGNVSLDPSRYELKVGEHCVKLTNKEYQLLELFILHPGLVFSTSHLMEKIWGLDTDSNIDVVWTHIGFVRKKLRLIGANVEIKTIRGVGYSLEEIQC